MNMSPPYHVVSVGLIASMDTHCSALLLQAAACHWTLQGLWAHDYEPPLNGRTSSPKPQQNILPVNI